MLVVFYDDFLGYRFSRSFTTSSKTLNSNQNLSLDWSYVHCPGVTPLSALTIGKLLDKTAREHGDRSAIVSVHQDIRKSWNEFKEDSDKLAAGFLALGLERGERIGIWGPNTYEWMLTLTAAAKAGLILVQKISQVKIL